MSVLGTWRVFDRAPIRFAERMWAQVNWHYDTGHNVPAGLCPSEGCNISYDVITHFYLKSPQDASASKSQFPWPYPLEP